MIEIRSFRKCYGDRLILEKDSLDIPKGIHWVAGQNGSGKSTFFKCLAGILPFKGQVKVENVILSPSSVEYRHLINYGEAEPIYPEFLTGKDLVSFVEKCTGASERQVSDLVNSLNVHQYMNDKIATYSSGMLKKLSLVLSFLGEPKWILLDEPFITLDQESQSVLTELVIARVGDGAGFLISSHQEWPQASIQIDSVLKVKDHTISE